MNYYTPANYVIHPNPERWGGHRSGRLYQYDVYLKAVEICQREHYSWVLDLGCGDGDKVHVLTNAGLNVIGVAPTINDIPESRRASYAMIFEADLDAPAFHAETDPSKTMTLPPDMLVLCADVIEHLVYPEYLLEGIAALKCRALISTPDRLRIYKDTPEHNGPPLNPGHVREWSRAEFARFVSDYMRVVESGGMPQFYDPGRDKRGPGGTQYVVTLP